jgi:NDP-sugar pyrophosphorylase family protein
MQIIIPMSGFGERFRQAGYTMPKPLIEVDGKPIIAHVLDMFPNEKDVLFICNREHLGNTNMTEVLNYYCPTGKIVAIETHKLGPVYAVSQAFEAIDDDCPTIVNYCDFTCYWDYSHFKQWLQDCGADGCVPAYRGFHPHSLGNTNYAFMRVKDGWMEEIQEKNPFTDNKMAEFASSGTYYFSQGRHVKRFFSEVMTRGLVVNGEYYCSVAYNLMVEAGLSVAVYELQHFMQWGTPEDLAEYRRWSDAFRALATPSTGLPPSAGTTLIPMAGLGSRFQQEGYKIPKPLLPVSGKPMVVQATRCLPSTKNYHFVALEQHLDSSDLQAVLTDQFPAASFTRLKNITDGQASTCLAALDSLPVDKPLTISSCDHGVIYTPEHFNALMADPNIDILVWVCYGHPGAIKNPNMYGWVKTEGDQVTGVSVKKPLQDPATDPIIIGTFSFKRAEMFRAAAQRLIERNGRVNGELYVDSCIEDAIALGYRVRVLTAAHYLCWGTPDDLKTFEYWQSCFHKWGGHPYQWQDDRWWLESGKREDIYIPNFAPLFPKLPKR